MKRFAIIFAVCAMAMFMAQDVQAQHGHRGHGGGYKGKRLFMTKVREETDSELLYSLRRRHYPNDEQEVKFLVFFKLDKVLPLIGAGD